MADPKVTTYKTFFVACLQREGVDDITLRKIIESRDLFRKLVSMIRSLASPHPDLTAEAEIVVDLNDCARRIEAINTLQPAWHSGRVCVTRALANEYGMREKDLVTALVETMRKRGIRVTYKRFADFLGIQTTTLYHEKSLYPDIFAALIRHAQNNGK